VSFSDGVHTLTSSSAPDSILPTSFLPLTSFFPSTSRRPLIGLYLSDGAKKRKRALTGR
jgi:hypothetical protein